ncbi:MAG TPA: hypothetical protein VIX59_18430 [Candidatus Binataceae bacterium]
MAAFGNRAVRIGVRSLLIGAVLMLAVGCGDSGSQGINSMKSVPDVTPTQWSPAEKQIALTFDLDKCVPLQAGLYKCPAVDQPICQPNFNNPGIQCLRIGHQGNVFVQQLGTAGGSAAP